MAGAGGRAVELRQVSGGAGSACATTLASLPARFAAPDANAACRETAERSPTIVAEADGTAIGLAVLSRHSPEAAELTLLAVRPEWHRQGVGRRLVELAERVLVEEGVEYLQVKTLWPGIPIRGTRRRAPSTARAGSQCSKSCRRSGARATRRCSCSRRSPGGRPAEHRVTSTTSSSGSRTSPLLLRAGSGSSVSSATSR